MNDAGRSLAAFLPELVLTVTVAVLVLYDLFARGEKRIKTTIIAAAGITTAAAIAASYWCAGKVDTDVFSGMMALDAFALFFKFIFGLTGLLTLAFSMRSSETPETGSGEYNTLLVATVLGLFTMAGATDLLMMYLSLEMVSILSYVLAGFRQRNRASSEAALKYVIYGGVASGVMLYGLSIVFGITGATNLDQIHTVLADGTHWSFPLLFGVLLSTAGFGYKVAAAPFHMWCPDVYQGAPTPVTAFFSVGPKAAGFAMMIRFYYAIAHDHANLGALSEALPYLVGVISIGTMLIGNFTALVQNNLKRFLAYSSIAHAGYLLMGMATIGAVTGKAPQTDGLESILLYLALYLFMNLGAFLFVILMQETLGADSIDDLKGLASRAPVEAVCMAMFLFSMTGLPPFAGFIGKFYIFAAVLRVGGPFFYLLALVGIFCSAISLYFYARIVRAMFLDRSPNVAPIAVGRYSRALLVALAVPTLVLGVWWSPISDMAQRAFRGPRTAPVAPVPKASAATALSAQEAASRAGSSGDLTGVPPGMSNWP